MSFEYMFGNKFNVTFEEFQSAMNQAVGVRNDLFGDVLKDTVKILTDMKLPNVKEKENK